MTSAERYARDPAYGKPPNWGRLYSRHCPRDTDGCSRHSRMIAEEVLRDPASEVRRLLIDGGWEPDHWASSIEITVKALWEARAEIERLLEKLPEEKARRDAARDLMVKSAVAKMRRLDRLAERSEAAQVSASDPGGT